MKNIERGTIKHLVVLIITISVCGMILYPVYDYCFCKFITNSEFVYSFNSYVVHPVTAAIIAGTVLWLLEKKSDKK